jgi:threonine dehydrogenase-like Zn-dependent dehydrogenase
MKAIVNTAPGKVQWQDRPMPEPGPGQVRIRTAACGVCVTDLAMIAGWQRTGFPAIPGHEWSGMVDCVGPGVDRALLGRHCVAENVLSDGGEVGFEHPGGYGQYFLTEANNVYPLPVDFPLAVAALIEPLAVCVHASRRLRLEDRRSALVLGDGPIGLLMLLLIRTDAETSVAFRSAKERGFRGAKGDNPTDIDSRILKAMKVEHVALLGGRAARLSLAKDLAPCAVLNYHEAGPNVPKAILALPGAPFPTVIEASGSAAAMQAAMEVAPHGGKIVVMGDYGVSRAGFPWNQLLHRELELIGSNASAGAWPEAVRLALTGAVPLARLASRRLPAAAFAEALEMTRNSRDVVKVVMEWGSAYDVS